MTVSIQGRRKWVWFRGATIFFQRAIPTARAPRGATPSHSDIPVLEARVRGCLRECGAVGYERTAEIRGGPGPRGPPFSYAPAIY